MAGKNGISAGLATLAGILEREQRRGLGTVALSPSAVSLLRDLPRQFREETSARPVATEVANAVSLASPATSPPAAEPPRGFRLSPAPDGERTEAWRRQQLNAIFKAVKHCPECRGLGTLFETVVFADGNPNAEIVFVGEAPGAEEEKQKKPFIGPAGQKLGQILKAMGLEREAVYISNIVKFRPKKGDGRFQGATNRPPTQEEMSVSLPYIRAEIEVLRPRVVVALGRTAAEGLLEKGGSLASFRGLDHDFAGIPVVVTYHPSYLLRQESASQEEGMRAKRQVWEDMLRVMEHAGLPITEKQRKYFL